MRMTPDETSLSSRPYLLPAASLRQAYAASAVRNVECIIAAHQVVPATACCMRLMMRSHDLCSDNKS